MSRSLPSIDRHPGAPESARTQRRVDPRPLLLDETAEVPVGRHPLHLAEPAVRHVENRVFLELRGLRQGETEVGGDQAPGIADHGKAEPRGVPLLRTEQEEIEPFSLLSASQTDFDARWEELESNRERLPVFEYFSRSRMLAGKLWRAGGRRRAAMAFSSRLTSRGQPLLIPEYVEFALDAAEWLLDEDLPSFAWEHLREIERRLGEADVPAQLLTRFRHLRIRCMDALGAYTESSRAIEEAVRHAGRDDRARLEAEQSETHFLHGNFTEAVVQPE